jgi:hypothetical protein
MSVPISAPNRSVFFSRRVLLTLYLIVIGAVYARTVSFDFVSYDDYELIVQNADFLAHPSNIITAFGTHVFTGQRTQSAYYRPLLLASYIGDYKIWKLTPSGYHCMNILLHLLTAAVVLLIAYKVTGDLPTALFSGFMIYVSAGRPETKLRWGKKPRNIFSSRYSSPDISLYAHGPSEVLSAQRNLPPARR